MTLMIFLLALLPSCGERPTKVSLSGGNPPTFHLSGSGEIDRVVIEEADAEEQPNPDRTSRWEIVPIERGPHGLSGLPVEEIGKITYGVVPSGYRQKTPASISPPPLVPGRYYYFSFSTVNAPHAWGYFVIRNGKAEFASIRGNCIVEQNGKELKVPCGQPEY